MFLFLSKLLPLLIYPVGLVCTLLVAAVLLRRRTRLLTALLAACFLLLWLGGNRIVTMAAARSLEWRYAPPAQFPQADAIVVLGGATRAQSWPRATDELNEGADRLIYAYRLWEAGVAPHLLLTGGHAAFVTPETTRSEAAGMAELLRTIGVPAEAIWLEEASFNTYENALLSKPILEEQGAERVVLVTSALHMPRAAAIFRKLGIDVIPAPTDYLVTQADWEHYLRPDPAVQAFNLIPSADDLELTSQVLKEYIGIAIYRLRGWL